jgi:hypothetical protein
MPRPGGTREPSLRADPDVERQRRPQQPMAAQIRCHFSADEAESLDGVAGRCSAADTRRGPRSRWRRPQISIQSRHSSRTVRTHRSAWALAFGAWMSVLMIWVPSEVNTSSKAQVNLLSRSRMRNRGVVSTLRPFPFHRELPCPLDHPRPTRVACDTGESNLPRPKFEEEQHVQRREPDGLHREEVRGQDACGLRPKKHSPGDGRSSRCELKPLPSSTVRTVVADTETPSFLSSPWMRW